MAKIIDPNSIPSATNVKKIVKQKITLKNVMYGNDSEKDIDVEVLPFNRRNDAHVEFAYAYSDMLFRLPSAYKDVSEISRAYVAIFMVRTKEQEQTEDSDFTLVYNDLRACRTLFNQPGIQQALNDFLGNA